MKPIHATILASLCFGSFVVAEEAPKPPAPAPVRAFIDDEAPGWRSLGKDDFTRVNSADDTWTWKEDGLHCTGQPVSVIRTAKQFTNFEMVVEWSHQKPAGNSGVFEIGRAHV